MTRHLCAVLGACSDADKKPSGTLQITGCQHRSADVTSRSQPRSRGLPGCPPLGVPTALRPLHRAQMSLDFAFSKYSA